MEINKVNIDSYFRPSKHDRLKFFYRFCPSDVPSFIVLNYHKLTTTIVLSLFITISLD